MTTHRHSFAGPASVAASGRVQAAPLPAALRGMLSLADFEVRAQRLLPRPIFGYVAGAAEDNRSLNDNRQALDDYSFTTRVLVDVSRRNQAINLFGHEYAAPFGIAPMGIAALSAYIWISVTSG